MGSMISLGINKMEIDWGKNNVFNDHSKLFQINDFDKKVSYFFVDEVDENGKYKENVLYANGAKKKLVDIKERLELLGYDLISIEKKYNEHIKEYEFYTETKIELTFNEFSSFIKSLDISKVDNVFSAADRWDNGYDIGEYFRTCILQDKEIAVKVEGIIKKIEREYYDTSDFFEQMDPYIILRILAENELNLDYYVEWRYNDVVENGWVKREDIVQNLEEKNKILIVTEGSTDSFIIRRTINELYPNIVDFFEFIDMKENYPFTGVGNLKNFCQGLSKINTQNNIIVIFDNDTAGRAIYNVIKDIKKPKNLVFCLLPEHKEFKEFKTIGPFGEQKTNINGKAVSIECFLDLSSVTENPIVRWKNYDEKMLEYQGALENKDAYTSKFKKANLLDGTYDVRKLKYLIDYIIKQWINRK